MSTKSKIGTLLGASLLIGGFQFAALGSETVPADQLRLIEENVTATTNDSSANHHGYYGRHYGYYGRHYGYYGRYYGYYGRYYGYYGYYRPYYRW
jgi:hypothetical protein